MQKWIQRLLLGSCSFLALSCAASTAPLKVFPMDNVKAISYSGYRSGQGPGRAEPSEAELREDLKLLSRHWNTIRVYGSGPQSAAVLQIIDKEKLPLKVMLGAWLKAEVSNPACPWGGVYTEAELQQNRADNLVAVDQAIALAKTYPSLVTAISVGNEILVDWTDHKVPVDSVIAYVKRVKAAVPTPVTVADNYVPFQKGLDELVAHLDFITIHSYPIWEQKDIDVALAFAQQNYESVRQRHPQKPIAIGETGWATATNGVGIPLAFAHESAQDRYFKEMSAWSQNQGIPIFFFEAFDEDWKGGPDPQEPEKHWGLFTKDRRPKLAVKSLYPDLIP